MLAPRSSFLLTRSAQIFTVVDWLFPEIVCVAAPAAALVIPRATLAIASEAKVTLLKFVALPVVSWHARTTRRMTRATCTNAKRPWRRRVRRGRSFGLRLGGRSSALRFRSGIHNASRNDFYSTVANLMRSHRSICSFSDMLVSKTFLQQFRRKVEKRNVEQCRKMEQCKQHHRL